MPLHTSILSKTGIVCLLACICCALWGSAFPCVKIGYTLFSVNTQHVPSIILFAGTRFFLAGILAILIGSFLSKTILIPKSLSTAKRIIKLSFLQTMIQYFLFYIGLAHTTGVKASIIGSSNVFVSLLVAVFLFHQEKMTMRKLAGCILGFFGVLLVNLNQGGLSGGIQFMGEGFLFLSTVSYAFSSVFLKIYSKDDHPVLLSGWQFIVGGAIMMILGFLFGGQITPTAPASFLMLFYLGCISAVAYSLWGILLKYNSVSRVTVFSFMTPVFGVLFSTVFLQEVAQSAGFFTITALILVCCGIYAVNSNAHKARISQ